MTYYNSREKLPKTLEHLQNLRLDESSPAEIIFVDNNSSDESTDFIRQTWSGPMEAIFVTESHSGVSWARRTGLKACRFDTIGIVDDDNWVDPDWAEQGLAFMDSHPQAGGVGSLNRAAFEGQAPGWFERYQGSYAVGPQRAIAANPVGLGVIWGAGCFLRKEAVDQALSLGVDPIISSRIGSGLLSGDETEIMMLMQLFGWRFYYEPAIKMTHYISYHRLTWEYYKRFREGFGRTSVYIDMYRRLVAHYQLGVPLEKYDWKGEQSKARKAMLQDLPGLISTRLPGFEGNYRTSQALFRKGIWAERHEKGPKLAEVFESLQATIADKLG